LIEFLAYSGARVGEARAARWEDAKFQDNLIWLHGTNLFVDTHFALLTYVLLRYLSHLSKWAHSFTRLFTILRAALWEKYDLCKLLACYGTAGGSFRNLARPEQAYFPGFL
jgi:hypothetical protein